jgi:hypothetical protein
VSKAKRDRESGAHEQPPPERPPFPSPRLTSLVAVGGVAALVVLGCLTWGEIRRIRLGLDGRLAQIDGQLTKLASRLEPAAPAARKGPDPNRVYAVKTDGSPTRGPAAAPVTIAEFSDFQ